MNKKLIAVLLAGALGAPGVALAQANTVQIYGRMAADYGVHVNQLPYANGAGRPTTDMFDSRSSRLGFKGTEKLGNGMSAWFQCESTPEFLTGDFSGFCDRNSALGFKGGFGNVFVGSWDSPLKVAFAATRMSNNGGFLGTRHMMLRGPRIAAVNRFDFARRNNASVNYETPRLGGFAVRGQYTAAQNAATAAPPGPRDKRRNLGLGADYKNGPLVVAAAWAKHEDAAVAGRDDTGWVLGATYKIGNFKGGITHVDLQKEPTATTSVDRQSWNYALEYDMSGPGSIFVVHTRVGDLKGTAAGAGPDTGAQKWMIGYEHSLSKRNTVGVAYVRLNNDTRGNHSFSEAHSTDVLGGSGNALVLSAEHRF